ncbi:MAG TPA: hypothetical protein VGE47_01890 [Burkholderiaceae bacterium]
MDTVADKPQDSARLHLQQDLQNFLGEVRALLGEAGSTGCELGGAARERFDAQLQRARAELQRLEGLAVDGGRRAVKATDEAAHAHPYAGMGVAAGLGLLLGWLIARR